MEHDYEHHVSTFEISVPERDTLLEGALRSALLIEDPFSKAYLLSHIADSVEQGDLREAIIDDALAAYGEGVATGYPSIDSSYQANTLRQLVDVSLRPEAIALLPTEEGRNDKLVEAALARNDSTLVPNDVESRDRYWRGVVRRDHDAEAVWRIESPSHKLTAYLSLIEYAEETNDLPASDKYQHEADKIFADEGVNIPDRDDYLAEYAVATGFMWYADRIQELRQRGRAYAEVGESHPDKRHIAIVKLHEVVEDATEASFQAEDDEDIERWHHLAYDHLGLIAKLIAKADDLDAAEALENPWARDLAIQEIALKRSDPSLLSLISERQSSRGWIHFMHRLLKVTGDETLLDKLPAGEHAIGLANASVHAQGERKRQLQTEAMELAGTDTRTLTRALSIMDDDSRVIEVLNSGVLNVENLDHLSLSFPDAALAIPSEYGVQRDERLSGSIGRGARFDLLERISDPAEHAKACLRLYRNYDQNVEKHKSYLEQQAA